jgi:hypothetical protein
MIGPVPPVDRFEALLPPLLNDYFEEDGAGISFIGQRIANPWDRRLVSARLSIECLGRPTALSGPMQLATADHAFERLPPARRSRPAQFSARALERVGRQGQGS